MHADQYYITLLTTSFQRLCRNITELQRYTQIIVDIDRYHGKSANLYKKSVKYAFYFIPIFTIFTLIIKSNPF